MLRTLSATLGELVKQGGLAFWYEKQLDRYTKSRDADKLQQALSKRKRRHKAEDDEDDVQAFRDAWDGIDEDIKDDLKQFITIGDDLKSQLDEAYEQLAETQRKAAHSKRRRKPNQLDSNKEERKFKDEAIKAERMRFLEAMWIHYDSLDEEQLKEYINSAKQLKTITDDVAELMKPAAREEATSGKWFVLASEPRPPEREKPQRCGVLIHRPQHLDSLAHSKYLELEFHRHVHWVSLLGAVNLIRNYPGAM